MISKTQIQNLDLEPWLIKILIILYYFVIIFSISIPFFVIYMYFNPIDFESQNKNLFLDRKFEGVIIENFIDVANHSIPTIIFDSKMKVGINKDLFCLLEKGDSIVKKKGELSVDIYKVNNTFLKYKYINK